MKKLTLEEFTERSKEIFSNKYDYSSSVYSSRKIKLKIVCPDHGEFEQTPDKHLSGQSGCKGCKSINLGNSRKSSIDEFLEKAIKIHGDTYDYSKTNYVKALDKIIIICRHHGDFEQAASKHLMGQGCPRCKGSKLRDIFALTKNVFLERAEELHKNLYDYSEVKYVNYKTPVKIFCNKHHEYFWKSPGDLLKPQGCPKCSNEKQSLNSIRSVSDTIRLASLIHGNTYDYSKVELASCKNEVTVICKFHGEFSVTMDNHLNAKSGCPKCSHIVSKKQIELSEYVISLGFEILENYKLKNNTEIDIFIPSLNIGLEFNGLYWHSENYKPPAYHLNKSNNSNAEGIRLVHIWEDEWVLHKDKTKAFLSNLLGKSTLKYNARQGFIQEISWDICSEFLNSNHLQNACAPTSMCYGLYIKNTLISVMCFTSSTVKTGEVELIRFCSLGNVRGGFSKLLKYFINLKLPYNSIISFSEKRWSLGQVYSASGFTKEGETPPAYWWCKGIDRYHRRGFQHRYLSSKLKVYDPSLSESENCKANGFFKVWDCGKDKWILQINR